MRAEDLDRLRDRMTIELLEATSSDTARQRVRLEEDFNYPAYDPDPQSNLRHIEPRHLIKRCDHCRCLFLETGQGGARVKRFCSSRCQAVAKLRAHKEAV